MSAVLAILYYVIRYWFGDVDFQTSLSDYFKRTGIFFLYVCEACLLSAVSLIPSLYVLLNAMKSSGIESSFFPTIRSLAFWILSLTTPNTIFGHYSYTGTNSLLLATIPLFSIANAIADNRILISGDHNFTLYKDLNLMMV